MKKLLTASLATLVLLSCSKKNDNCFPHPAPGPAMKYLDLADAKVSFGKSYAMDLDGNGTNDFFISTALIGSPIDQRDYQDYYFNGNLYSYIPVNTEEGMPNLSIGEAISGTSFPNHAWYNASQLLLSRRVIPMQDEPFWTGSWKDASHRYVPVAILKGDQYCYGWVELSFDKTQSVVILHKAAISLKPGAGIKAGL